MAFHDIRFPTDISLGVRGGPGYNTNIIEYDSGKEERVQRWDPGGRRKYEARYAVKTRAELMSVVDFYLGRQGVSHSFRFKDWQDYTTASDGISAFSGTDAEFGTGDGTETTFQLVKRYTSGSQTAIRNITKISSDATPIVTIDDVVESAANYSIADTTGIITFNTAPAGGETLKWGGQFDTHVRFGNSLDEAIISALDNPGYASIPTVPLIEVLDEIPAPEDFNYGGATFASITSTYTMDWGSRVWSFDADGAAGLTDINLPDKDDVPMGGPYFYIFNVGSTNDIRLRDPFVTTGEDPVDTLNPSEARILVLGDDHDEGTTALRPRWFVFSP